MIDITMRHTFDGPGTSTARNVAGASLLVQTTVGMTATVQGSNLPDVEVSWRTLGTASGLNGVPLTCNYAYLRVQADAAGTVSISAQESSGAGSNAGGATEATLSALNEKVPALAGGKTPVADAENLAMVTNVAARLGATDDAAAASDSATSSLIGLFKRLLVKFPGLGSPTSRSSTITAGGTAQQLCAANTARVGLIVQNLSTGDLWINDLGTASAAQPSIRLQSGAYWETPPNYGAKGAVSIFGATTGQAFSAREF